MSLLFLLCLRFFVVAFNKLIFVLCFVVENVVVGGGQPPGDPPQIYTDTVLTEGYR